MTARFGSLKYVDQLYNVNGKLSKYYEISWRQTSLIAIPTLHSSVDS